jgi:thiamine-phosphate pyrophosphorylase
MKGRQSEPRQWLIVNAPPDPALWQALRRLPRDSGVLLLLPLPRADRLRLRQMASLRRLTVVVETPRAAARIHGLRELTGALLRRSPLVLISPLYPTATHPEWKPLRRMRAAALARLANRSAIALGVMKELRFRRVQRLGFIGWAGISEFRN